jgi:DNA-binding XRE family transcriptional regulator
MKKAKRKKLEAAGWKVDTVETFLNLTPEEMELVEMKVLLAKSLRELRSEHNLTQTQLARQLGSSQSRVAKLETADPSVSLELLVKSLLILGKNRHDVANVISR